MKSRAHLTLAKTSLIILFGVLLLHGPVNAMPGSSEETRTSRGMATFSLSDPPGVALVQPDTLLVAVQLNNAGQTDAFDVTISSVELNSTTVLSPTPARLGKIAAGGSRVVEASFSSGQLTEGNEYPLVVRGSYRVRRKVGEGEAAEVERKEHKQSANKHAKQTDEDEDEDEHEHERNKGKGKRHKFVLTTVIVMPPAAPGEADLNAGDLPSNSLSGGPFPHQPPQIDEEINQAAPPVPTTPFVPGTPTPTSTFTTPAPFGDPPAIVFKANNGVGLTSAGVNCSSDSKAVCAEPSGASGGGIIFVTTNWSAAYSTDGGTTFIQLDPTTIFKDDEIGFCCDQIVQYIPSIGRFVWLLQGKKPAGYRLAIADPADIRTRGGMAFRDHFWNLTPQFFGQPKGTGFDYPDLSVGNNFIYMSWNAGGTGCPKGCHKGFQVARIAFAGIRAGGTIHVEWTDPSKGPAGITWGDHLTQNTGDEAFWAGHNGNTALRVFSVAEASHTYSWRDVGISSWANNAPTSLTPDGQDWLAKNFNGPKGDSFPRNGIIGATRSGKMLWFAWSAGTNSNFQQAHVEMVTLDRSNSFKKVQQMQIWNSGYAFAYPSLATNACTGEVGLSFEFGGNGNYENHVVGFWGDFVAYITTGSNVGTDRFGDYVTIRQAPGTQSDPGNLFTAFGYGINSVTPPATGTSTDIHYVSFGRPATSCAPLIP